MTLLKYRGYTGRVEVDLEAETLFGEVIDIRDVITFEGDTVVEIVRAFHDSVDDYLTFCHEKGIAPEKPFSGQFLVRTTPEHHRMIAEAAAASRSSITRWADAALFQAAAIQLQQTHGREASEETFRVTDTVRREEVHLVPEQSAIEDSQTTSVHEHQR